MEFFFLLCLQILNNADLDDTLRHLALEVIVTLAENAPASVRKVGKFLPGLVHTLLVMMTDLEDDPEWAVQVSHMNIIFISLILS